MSKTYKKIQKVNQAVLDLFKDVVTIDEVGNAATTAVIWSSFDNWRLCIDKMPCPVLCVESVQYGIADPMPIVDKAEIFAVYDLHIITKLAEDMNQICEQVLLKFDNKANCKLTSLKNDYENHVLYQGVFYKVWCGLITIKDIDKPILTRLEL